MYFKNLWFIRLLKILVGITLGLKLCGCGQDGPLYLPPPKLEVIEPCEPKTANPAKPEHASPGNAKKPESEFQPSGASKNPENPKPEIKTPKAD